VHWSRGFILFHGKRHPNQMGWREIVRYLEQVARGEPEPVAALDGCRRALTFLYEDVLHQEIDELPVVRPPRLLDQVQQVLRVKHYSYRTEECYLQWIKRYILFHHKRHPRDMGVAEVEQFLTDLAVRGRVSASTQNQALKPVGSWQLAVGR
jgi:hypothetical protein